MRECNGWKQYCSGQEEGLGIMLQERRALNAATVKVPAKDRQW